MRMAMKNQSNIPKMMLVWCVSLTLWKVVDKGLEIVIIPICEIDVFTTNSDIIVKICPVSMIMIDDYIILFTGITGNCFCVHKVDHLQWIHIIIGVLSFVEMLQYLFGKIMWAEINGFIRCKMFTFAGTISILLQCINIF